MIDYKYSQQRGSVQESAQTFEPRVNLDAIPSGVIELVPASVAQTHLVIPISISHELATLAAEQPNDIKLVDKLTFLLNRKIKLVYAPRHEIVAALERYYPSIAACDEEEYEMCLEEASGARPGWARRKSIASLLMDPSGYLGKSVVEFKKGMHGEPGAAQSPLVEAGKGEDTTQAIGVSGMFFHVVEEGQRVLVRESDGSLQIVAGPKRLWAWGRSFQPMRHFIAHPGEFLIVRYRDGRQEHLVGPTEIWFDPRVHQAITSEAALQLSDKEAVVVYSKNAGSDAVSRRIVNGPAQFMPQPGEWLHTFTWHASQGGHLGAVKIPRGLVFQKLWLLPDQMYHDVTDVRTADDAVLTIRLMIFFELINIERMLETTHDPIGDFVNAATSDVVAFVGKYDFEAFKRNVGQLNELDTYRQLASRAEQCGYRINKVVYRGYGAPDALQKMHDEAIEARTKLQLQRATEQQAQDLENYKLDCQITRAVKRREEQSSEVDHDLDLVHRRQQAALEDAERKQSSRRDQSRLEAEQQLAMREKEDAQRRAHLASLRELGVDLTAYLTQARADRVIELRGSSNGTHVHLDALASEEEK
jgi:type II secretion system (T2SS) protein E